VDHLEGQAQKTNIGVACIFLDHKETEIQTIPNLVGGVWSQLVLGKSIPADVWKLYDPHKERRIRPQLNDFLRVLNLAAAVYPKVYLVIDALDEYPEEKQHSFLQYLGKLSAQINILITSRPHINLEPIFANLQIIDIYATDADIHKYLDGQIQNSLRLSRHIRTCPELRGQVHSEIISSSKGM
jgi:hypothetical protein